MSKEGIWTVRTYWQNDLVSAHLSSERVKGQNHGVGCTFSAALTSFLAMGCSLKEAAQKAKEFAKRALRGSFHVGKGVGPVNQAAFLREEASRYHVFCDIRDAVDLLGNELNLFKVVLHPGSNLGMAIPSAATPADVASVEVGLVKDGRRVRPSGGIKFGDFGDIASIILAAMSHDPQARAAMNLSPMALPACKALGLSIMEINQFDDWDAIPGIEVPGQLPDVILVKGAPGEEPRLYLLGASATLLARRAVSLAGGFGEHRKI